MVRLAATFIRPARSVRNEVIPASSSAAASEHPGRPLHDEPPAGGQLGTARAAGEQRDPDAYLHRADPLGQRLLRHAQLRRGQPQASGTGDHREHLQGGQLRDPGAQHDDLR